MLKLLNTKLKRILYEIVKYSSAHYKYMCKCVCMYCFALNVSIKYRNLNTSKYCQYNNKIKKKMKKKTDRKHYIFICKGRDSKEKTFSIYSLFSLCYSYLQDQVQKLALIINSFHSNIIIHSYRTFNNKKENTHNFFFPVNFVVDRDRNIATATTKLTQSRID